MVSGQGISDRRQNMKGSPSAPCSRPWGQGTAQRAQERHKHGQQITPRFFDSAPDRSTMLSGCSRRRYTPTSDNETSTLYPYKERVLPH